MMIARTTQHGLMVRTLVLLAMIAALATALTATPACATQADRTVTVMTYNMDAGTDFLYLMLMPPEQFPTAVELTVQEILGTNFAERAASLADRIAEQRPDLVALQEVTLWEMRVAGKRQAIADQLDLLADALAAKGQSYSVVTVERLTDLSVPLSEESSIRFVDRDAVLVRNDQGTGALRVSNVQAGKYRASTTVLGTFEQVNGWISVDVKVGPRAFRFFATHLEAPMGPEDLTQVGQAEELLALMNASALPVVIAGDFNSDASGMGLGPDQTPTVRMLTDAGYADAWEALRPGEPGFTWPLYLEDVWEGREYFPGQERIDLIFAKGVVPLAVTAVGLAEPFPSDHAGVCATMRLEW